MASSTTSDWDDTFNEIKTNHDAAYRKIDEALRLEEEGQSSRALRLYEEGLVLIDKALSATVECPESPDFTWEKACSMLDKLKKTRKEVLIRVADSQVQRFPEFQVEPPPSYEEAISSPSYTPVQSPSAACSLSSESSLGPSHSRSLSPNSLPLTCSELGEALRSLKVETGAQSAQVIYSVDSVRLYFISPNGIVSAPSQPNQLRILQLEDGGEQNVPKYYLQVGDWFYPLVPDVSPCFRSDFGAFILPDLHSSVEGAAVGIVLPPEADESVYKFLDDVLHGIVTQRPVPPPRKAKAARDISMTISRGLVTGAQYLSSGLVKGAEKASELISHNTPKLISKLEPETSPRHVPSSVRTGVKVARDVTGTAVSVTGYVAGKIGGATMALGRYLAPHIQRGGTKLLKKAGVAEDTAADQVGGVLTIAAGAVEGFGTVYTGLEQSAKILGTSLADNTVQVVQYKYGEPMGEVTEHSLYTVGNVVLATNNVKNLTPKGIAKKTAKDAGKAVVESHRAELQNWAKENNPQYHNEYCSWL